MAPRVPSVSTASGSLSRKNSRGSAYQDEELIMTDGRDANRHQKEQTHLSPPPRNTPTRIPLTSDYKIPTQILNAISSSADPSMTLIELDNSPLGDSEVSRLAHALMTNTTIQTISLRHCKITDRAVQTLADCLQRNATLTALHLDANRITREGCAALSTALIQNETLTVLTLNRNRDLGDKGVAYLINALEHNSTLLTLEVNDCGVQESRLKQIESILADRQLDSAFESLLERLRDDDFRVTGIDMTGREIGDEGAIRLAGSLVDNTQVRQLWLRSCQIGDKGAKALASCLEQNMAITELYLAKNAIGDEGVTAIADALGLSNLTLVTMELDDNRVGDKGIVALTQAMERNTSVLEATFENNAMLRNSAKLQKLQRMLKERKNGLNAVSFVVDPETAAEKAEAEKENKGIVDMSVCSSYMPSTYRRAGFNSVTDSKPVKGKKVQIVAEPNVLPPPPTPNRKRDSSSRRVRSSAPTTALVATNKAPSKADNLSKTNNDPAMMSPILEGSHETSPGVGTSQSRSSKKSGAKAALVPVEQERKESSKPVKPQHSVAGGVVANVPDASLSDPQTQRNFDDTIKTLFRRVETMLRVNHYSSIYYRARHHWLYFVPISSCIGLSGLLALVNAFNISGQARLGLGLSACAFALVAFIFGFLQTRFGWSSKAEIHTSTQMELSQVAFRLENLSMYQNGKLLSASLSPESRAHAIRDLYRIDAYLQAMQQCTPDPPESIDEAFRLMSSRLRLMCLRYPHVVKHRFAEYGEEPAGSSNPVPVDMHVDALDLLASEIEAYYLYPILLPDPSSVVSRTIDIFFAPRAQSVAPSYASSGYDSYDEEDVDYESVYSDEDM